MTPIDSVGAYRGIIEEAGLGATKRGFPQFMARIKATEKYVDDPEWMKHFKLEEPAWMDWTEYNEEITAYLVLFNDPDEFSEQTSLTNYDQLQKAIDWDGTEFDTLNNDTAVGKSVLIRVAENTYNDKTSLQVEWIDAPDASPTRELRKLDAESVKELASKLKVRKKKAKPAVAKPASKPASAPVESVTSTAKATEPAGKKATPPPAPPAEETPVSGLPTEITRDKAWEFVLDHKGGNTDKDVESAWIDACGDVGGNKVESDFTDTDWAAVRDVVVKDLALDV